jgi:hypothetical protein
MNKNGCERKRKFLISSTMPIFSCRYRGNPRSNQRYGSQLPEDFDFRA